MSDEIQFFTDLEGTIPAKNGDRVALAKNLGGHGIDGRSVFPHQRPLLKDGYLWFDQITDEIDRLRAENERLRSALRELARVTRGWEPGVWTEEEGRKYFAALFFSAQKVARAALKEEGE